MREREHLEKYTLNIGLRNHVRVHIESEGSRMVHFAVTLEHELGPSDWRPVARYDTTGGKVHRDRLKPDGTYLAHRERVRFGLDLDAALVHAREDLITEADRYVSDYLALLDNPPYDEDE